MLSSACYCTTSSRTCCGTCIQNILGVKQLCRKGTGGPRGHQVEHEAVVCPCGKGVHGVLGCTRRAVANRLRKVIPSHLLSAGKATPGVQGPVLGYPVQKRYRVTGASPLNGHEETWASLLQVKAGRPGSAQPGEGKAQRGSSSMVTNMWREGVKQMGTGSFQLCPEPEPEPVGPGASVWTTENTFFPILAEVAELFEMCKSHLNMVLSTCSRQPCSSRVNIRWPPEVPSELNCYVILWMHPGKGCGEKRGSFRVSTLPSVQQPFSLNLRSVSTELLHQINSTQINWPVASLVESVHECPSDLSFLWYLMFLSC